MTDGNDPQGQPSYHQQREHRPKASTALGPAASDLAVELARMRERFTFFEAFDGQIQDTIASSTELLRTAAAMHTTASQEAIASLASLERTVAAEQTRQQRLFDSVRDELNETRQQAERLTADTDDISRHASRLAQRVAHLSLILESSIRTDQVPQATPASQSTAPDTPEPGATAFPTVPAATSPTTHPPTRPQSPPPAPPDEQGAAPGIGTRRLPMTLVFQRVANAAVARTLQRHIDRLDVVAAVSSCEYSGNVLRLHLMVVRPITLDDLATLPGADELEPLRILPDVLVLRLPERSTE